MPNKRPRDRWGAPIFGDTKGYQVTTQQPGNQQQDNPSNVSGIGLNYPHVDRQTMGAENQTQFTAQQMLISAMQEIGESPVVMGPESYNPVD